MFIVIGTLHVLNPEGFSALMWPMNEALFTFLITFSGLAEIICALGLLFRHPWAGRLAALTLIAVWPANIWFAYDAVASGKDLWLIIIAMIRIPLQLPLIWFAWKSPRRA